MNDSELCKAPSGSLPVSFKVIGIGDDTADIIAKVASSGYDCVGCIIANTPDDCVPAEEDEMAIIVARENVELANAIARTYHDAGVLTVGLVREATADCFDSVVKEASCDDFPAVIESLLQPIVSRSFICYDFNDLSSALRDSGSFITLRAEAADIEKAVTEMQKSLGATALSGLESLSAHISFNHGKQSEIRMDDLKHLSDMLSGFPESTNAMWSMYFDDNLPSDKIRLTLILSGKEL